MNTENYYDKLGINYLDGYNAGGMRTIGDAEVDLVLGNVPRSRPVPTCTGDRHRTRKDSFCHLFSGCQVLRC